MRKCFLRDVEDGFYRPARVRSNQAIAALLSVTFLTLFIGFHITLYDSTVYQIQTQQQFPAMLNDQDFVFVDDFSPTLDPPLYEHQQYNITTTKRKLHFSKTKRRLPQVLIVGVRKCGTRALLEMLFLHPRIQKAAGEVHFFDRDENYSLGLEWYRQKMPFSFADQVTIEKSPSYFVTPEVPERVRAMNASIRLLLILREPVTRAISDYTQLKTHAASTTPQTKAAAVQKSFEELAIKADGEVNSSYRPICISMYHTFVLQWLEVFPREQMLIVNGDRLIEDPISEVQKIELFLGLEPKTVSSTVLKLRFGSAIIFLLPICFFSCFGAEGINELNTTVAEAVYNLPWHRESIIFKKLVPQFLLLLERPLTPSPPQLNRMSFFDSFSRFSRKLHLLLIPFVKASRLQYFTYQRW